MLFRWANIIKEELKLNDIYFLEKESIYISERQFGLLDDYPKIEETHPSEVNHFNLHLQNKHDFWARPPLGESPFDMCLRIDFFIKSILLKDNSDIHVLVSHGASVRGFIMMYLDLAFEQYTEMQNPANASIQLIEDNTYKGLIFKP